MAFSKIPEIAEPPSTCTFCLKQNNHYEMMIMSTHPPRAYICASCVDLCNQLLCQKQVGGYYNLAVELEEAYRKLWSEPKKEE